MMSRTSTHLRSGLMGLAGLMSSALNTTHDFRVGSIIIDHPYATPSPLVGNWG